MGSSCNLLRTASLPDTDALVLSYLLRHKHPRIIRSSLRPFTLAAVHLVEGKFAAYFF